MRKSAGLFRDMNDFAAAAQQAFERGHAAGSLRISLGEFGFEHVVQSWLDVGAIEVTATNDFADELHVVWLDPALALFFGRLGDDADDVMDNDVRLYGDMV